MTSVRPLPIAISLFAVCELLICGAMTQRARAADEESGLLKLTLRSRAAVAPDGDKFRVALTPTGWQAGETAIIIPR